MTDSNQILIVGAGIAGLFLATILERTKVSYHIYERAAKPSTAGSFASIGPNILPVFEQLGLLEELKKIGKPENDVHLHESNMKKLGSLNVATKIMTGYETYNVSHAAFHNLLLKQVPNHKISYNKQVDRIEEDSDSVSIYCSDNSTLRGSILVGADGAYSQVRRALFSQLNSSGTLPEDDKENNSTPLLITLGFTQSKYLRKFPEISDACSNLYRINDESLSFRAIYNSIDNQASWIICQNLSVDEAKAYRSENPEWRLLVDDRTLEEKKNLPGPWGSKIGDFIDATARENIAGTLYHEKIYKTWYHNRTVLIGDACHRLFPGFGLAAVHAMLDAVVLANEIHKMTSYTTSNTVNAFKKYSDNRRRAVTVASETSAMIANILAGYSMKDRIIRKALFGFIPSSFQQKESAKNYSCRPQLAWLPAVENRGSIIIREDF